MRNKTHSMRIGSIEITITKKPVKNLHLRVYPPHGQVHISSPLRMRDETIRQFAESKLPWIMEQQKRLTLQEKSSPHAYITGEKHYFEGQLYTLEVVYKSQKPEVQICGDTMILTVRPGSNASRRKEILQEWYRKELKNQIPELIRKWAVIIGREPSEWGIKIMKTRWGTCNTTKKRIWLNLELIKKKSECLEYVLVHEMVHLLERNHNGVFKNHMHRLLPEWQKVRDELNMKGNRN